MKKKRVMSQAIGSGKILILIPDWSSFKSLEPDAGHVTRKIGPMYFTSMKTSFFQDAALKKTGQKLP
jgi:hypothetical protein